jgi:hypothetical protein
MRSRCSSAPYGLQKSVELARALAGHPKLLLLDEPAAGMNPEESRRVAKTVRRLRDEDGITVLLIGHDMRVVIWHETKLGRRFPQAANSIPETSRRSPPFVGLKYCGTVPWHIAPESSVARAGHSAVNHLPSKPVTQFL